MAICGGLLMIKNIYMQLWDREEMRFMLIQRKKW